MLSIQRSRIEGLDALTVALILGHVEAHVRGVSVEPNIIIVHTAEGDGDDLTRYEYQIVEG